MRMDELKKQSGTIDSSSSEKFDHDEVDENDLMELSEEVQSLDISDGDFELSKANEGDSSSSEKLDHDEVDENDLMELPEEVLSIDIRDGDCEMSKGDEVFSAADNVTVSKDEGYQSADGIKHDDSANMERSIDNDNGDGDCEISKGDEGFGASDNVTESKDEGFQSADSVKRDDSANMERSIDNDSKFEGGELKGDKLLQRVDSGDKMYQRKNSESESGDGIKVIPGKGTGDKESKEPVSGDTELPGLVADRTISLDSTDAGPETEGPVLPGKAVTLRDFVKNKGVFAVSSFIRAISGKKDEIEQSPLDENKEAPDLANDTEAAEVSQKIGDKSASNPLSYIMTSRNVVMGNRDEDGVETFEEPLEPIIMRGRVILYTRLRCENCKEARLFLYRKRLRYVEININVYPCRKLELEKFTGSSAVPKVFFNEVVIGGLSELKALEESGKLEEKIDFLINEAPAYEAPLPPLSGEDDVSTSGSIDEFALIVRKMKETTVVKDRFYKMRRFSRCFLGSEAIEFLSEDQYLEKEDAIELGRKLASKLFFRHVLDENLFEDGNYVYWFLDDDPVVSQCQNIPRGIIGVKPKAITEIASRLRFLFYAMNEAYTSEDGKHIDYRTIHGSEEFARYLRIIQELQRVEFQDLSREEKRAFFINLYNMMVIHAILVLGYPTGALERRKFYGDFKYVIRGCIFSLSAIQNGVLRANQRPPYSFTKPFGVNDKRCKASLPYPVPLIHFVLVNGTRSGPALQCYSPGNIDKELMDAARNFLRGGGLYIDVNTKVAHVSKILKWFSVDFGKNEVEVLKHASNYLGPPSSESLLELLADGQLKVQYQPYDWGLNL